MVYRKPLFVLRQKIIPLSPMLLKLLNYPHTKNFLRDIPLVNGFADFFSYPLRDLLDKIKDKPSWDSRIGSALYTYLAFTKVYIAFSESSLSIICFHSRSFPNPILWIKDRSNHGELSPTARLPGLGVRRCLEARQMYDSSTRSFLSRVLQ